MTHNTTEERFKEKFGVYIADDTMYFPTTPSPREILAQIEDEKKIVREERDITWKDRVHTAICLIEEGYTDEEVRDYLRNLLSQEDTKKQDNNN